MNRNGVSEHLREGAKAAAGLLILAALYPLSLYSYLLFHSLAELFSVVIASGIFIIAWNSRSFSEDDFLLYIGIAYLFIGGLDLTHTLAYQGMGVFSGYGADLATQLWIAARYLESLSLLVASLLVRRRIRYWVVLALYGLLTAGLLASIFLRIFPVCFAEGSGLTPFKKISEYLISGILLFAIASFYLQRRHFDVRVLRLMIASIAVTIAAELSLTFYLSVYGFSNFLGHILKIISFYLIYQCVIETSLKEPYQLLFRNLKKHEQELEQALSRVKQLSGLLPMCASCKKIRDDKGYWKQVEDYLHDHSEAQFTHGLCPDCIAKFYPDYADAAEVEEG
jgi:hypothetical protein